MFEYKLWCIVIYVFKHFSYKTCLIDGVVNYQVVLDLENTDNNYSIILENIHISTFYMKQITLHFHFILVMIL